MENNELPNCWEILKCEREAGGAKVEELGECIASKEGMGHSCWAIAGTLCGGKVQGTIALKIGYCTSCEVHKLYNRFTGTKGKLVRSECPEEDELYNKSLLARSESKE